MTESLCGACAMTPATLRRRLHHGDVDGRKREHVEADSLDYLTEPLLGSAREIASLVIVASEQLHVSVQYSASGPN